ncbi:hypothetical protein [Cyclobacterium sp.]|nr:hypothetical protein [Cyclobacterium sp.]
MKGGISGLAAIGWGDEWVSYPGMLLPKNDIFGYERPVSILVS